MGEVVNVADAARPPSGLNERARHPGGGLGTSISQFVFKFDDESFELAWLAAVLA